jgi:hypothetical protein
MGGGGQFDKIMIYTDLKYQVEISLDYQYTFNFFLNVGQEEKINIFQG